jgi:3-isopropylmalate dehydrogenase
VLNVVLESKTELQVELQYHDFGGCAIDKYQTPLPEETLVAAKNADAILLGAVGGPKW